MALSCFFEFSECDGRAREADPADPVSRHMSGSEIWLVQRSKLAIVTGVFASLSLKIERERQICSCNG
jgi:hypothetical protein